MVASLIPETVAADSLLTLAVGVTVLAALGYLIAARLRPLAWQRAVWQVVLLAIAGVTAAELAGLSSCLSHLVAAHLQEQGIEGGLVGRGGDDHGRPNDVGLDFNRRVRRRGG